MGSKTRAPIFVIFNIDDDGKISKITSETEQIIQSDEYIDTKNVKQGNFDCACKRKYRLKFHFKFPFDVTDAQEKEIVLKYQDEDEPPMLKSEKRFADAEMQTDASDEPEIRDASFVKAVQELKDFVSVIEATDTEEPLKRVIHMPSDMVLKLEYADVTPQPQRLKAKLRPVVKLERLEIEEEDKPRRPKRIKTNEPAYEVMNVDCDVKMDDDHLGEEEWLGEDPVEYNADEVEDEEEKTEDEGIKTWKKTKASPKPSDSMIKEKTEKYTKNGFCTICGEELAASPQLQWLHMCEKHKQKVLLCELCGDSFTNYEKMWKHKKSNCRPPRKNRAPEIQACEVCDER